MSSIDKETGIWALDIACKRHKCDLMLAAIIGFTYSPETFIDIGCGDGRYCKIFKAYGWKNVVGIEGTKGVKNLGVFDSIVEADLTKHISIPELFTIRTSGNVVSLSYNKWDLVMCLEVGEHIPKKYEQVFIDNLCSFVGKELILSWAPPGQYSASGHVNLQSKDYIISEVEKRGLKLIVSKAGFLQEYASFSWFKKNLMVFEK